MRIAQKASTFNCKLVYIVNIPHEILWYNGLRKEYFYMNFIFDIGNVLVRFEPLKSLEELFPDKLLAKKLYSTIFLSPEWELLDNGYISHAEATATFCKREPDLAPTITEFMKNVCDIFTPLTETIELLPEIKNNSHNLYYLSNMHSEIKDYLLKRDKHFSLFDGGIFSCDINIIKPSAEIYQRILDDYQLIPSECVFFDDVQVNVDAAQKAGINGVLFKNAGCIKPFI